MPPTRLPAELLVKLVFATAVGELCAIFAASRLRRDVQARRHAGLITALLGAD